MKRTQDSAGRVVNESEGIENNTINKGRGRETGLGLVRVVYPNLCFEKVLSGSDLKIHFSIIDQSKSKFLDINGF